MKENILHIGKWQLIVICDCCSSVLEAKTSCCPHCGMWPLKTTLRVMRKIIYEHRRWFFVKIVSCRWEQWPEYGE